MISVIEPFPADALVELYRWLAAVPRMLDADEFPKDWPAFESTLREKLKRIRSWGVFVWDFKDDEPAPDLVGAVLLEPVGTMGAQAYVAAPRRAWGKGYLDEAVRRIMAQVFTEPWPLCAPTPLDHVFGLVMHWNHPAMAFNERVGMRVKNVFPQAGSRMYEMTREQWRARSAQMAPATTGR